MFRRRRRGLAVLPQFRGAGDAPAYNPNQGPYLGSNSVNQQQAWGGQPIRARAPPEEPAPPPPYPGKPDGYELEENSGYGYPNPPPPDGAMPSSGGFMPPSSPPPQSPPAAHIPVQSNVSPGSPRRISPHQHFSPQPFRR